MTLGDVIARFRDAHGISMDKFSEMSGISKTYISMLERNQTQRGKEPTPSIETYRNAAKGMGMDVDELIRMVDGKIQLNSNGEVDSGKNLPIPIITENTVTFRVNTDIAAGYDQPAQPLDDWEGAEVEIPTSMLRGRSSDEYFVIRICGDSMYPQYQNGDYVLVLRTDVLDHSGQVAVMLCGEEGTIKKVEYKEGESWYKLIPINPLYPPKTIEGPEVNTCRIIGVPKLIVREVYE